MNRVTMYRSDVVGSLLRPEYLKQARAQFEAGALSDAAFKQIEDRAVPVLDRLIAERGAPQRIRSDNGPEFTSRAYLAWSLDQRIELVHIRPGKPIENAYIKSFNGRLRAECLNAIWFHNLIDARTKIRAWQEEYNGERSHSSLGGRTPNEFAASWNPQL